MCPIVRIGATARRTKWQFAPTFASMTIAARQISVTVREYAEGQPAHYEHFSHRLCHRVLLRAARLLYAATRGKNSSVANAY